MLDHGWKQKEKINYFRVTILIIYMKEYSILELICTCEFFKKAEIALLEAGPVQFQLSLVHINSKLNSKPYDNLYKYEFVLNRAKPNGHLPQKATSVQMCSYFNLPTMAYLPLPLHIGQ